jgi:hypothetical protein
MRRISTSKMLQLDEFLAGICKVRCALDMDVKVRSFEEHVHGNVLFTLEIAVQTSPHTTSGTANHQASR